MSEDELESQLEIIRKTVSRTEFVQILLDRLDQNPSSEELDLLQVWLQAYGYKDERVIRYWQKLLLGNDREQQERAVNSLLVKCLTGNELACEILQEFLGEEPTLEAVKKRLFRRLGLK
jgi:hypothetical protein